jgi:hypothetical protein
VTCNSSTACCAESFCLSLVGVGGGGATAVVSSLAVVSALSCCRARLRHHQHRHKPGLLSNQTVLVAIAARRMEIQMRRHAHRGRCAARRPAEPRFPVFHGGIRVKPSAAAQQEGCSRGDSLGDHQRIVLLSFSPAATNALRGSAMRRRMNGWTDGWIGGWISELDRWADGWMGGWTD